MATTIPQKILKNGIYEIPESFAVCLHTVMWQVFLQDFHFQGGLVAAGQIISGTAHF